MNDLTRKASHSELREQAMDYAAVLIGLVFAVMLAGGV